MREQDHEGVLELTLAQIEKRFGKGTIMRLGDEPRAPAEVIPTGSVVLDHRPTNGRRHRAARLNRPWRSHP